MGLFKDFLPQVIFDICLVLFFSKNFQIHLFNFHFLKIL